MKSLKRSLITQNISVFKLNTQLNASHVPQMGDVAVFEVISIGKHKSIQNTEGLTSTLFPNDHFLATFGTRYASNQFEGYLPTEPQLTYDILGQGGVVGTLHSSHSSFKGVGSTKVRLVGYAVNEHNDVINTRYHGLVKETFKPSLSKPYQVYLSVGASMDSGKTTTAAYFSRGITLAEKRVAYMKLTGTVHNKDRRLVKDCGAVASVDFSMCGYPSTFTCSTDEVLDIYATLIKQVELVEPDVVVVEIADGLLQTETAKLLKEQIFMQQVDGVILSCPDSLSVMGGMATLASFGIEPVMISGLATASPLMVREIERIAPIPVYGLHELVDSDKIAHLISQPQREPVRCRA